MMNDENVYGRDADKEVYTGVVPFGCFSVRAVQTVHVIAGGGHGRGFLNIRHVLGYRISVYACVVGLGWRDCER